MRARPAPKLSDAELICLAVAQVLLGYDSERRWLRFASQRLGHLFSYLPTSSAYNRRLRRTAALVCLTLQDIAAHAQAGATSSAWSTPLRCRARPAARRSAGRHWPATPATATATATTALLEIPAVGAGRPRRPPGRLVPGHPKLGEREVVAAMLERCACDSRPLVSFNSKATHDRVICDWPRLLDVRVAVVLPDLACWAVGCG